MVTNGAIFSSRKEMFLKSQIIFAGRGITVTASLMSTLDNSQIMMLTSLPIALQ